MDKFFTEFFVSGVPAPQPRPKAAIIAGHVHIYTPNTADAWRRAVRDATDKAFANRERSNGAVSLRVKFYLPRPKSHFGTGKNAGVLKPKFYNACPTAKPDIDNLLKSTMDAIGGTVRVWHDDAQVVCVKASKEYAPTNIQTGAFFHIDVNG